MSNIPANISIYGTVSDSTGQTLPQANVYVSDANGVIAFPQIGAAADNNGIYSISSIPAGSYVTASYVGSKQTIKTTGSGKYDFKLNVGITGNTATITANKFNWWVVLAITLILFLIIYLIVR
jgi:hypothetical protein